jgi:butyrate kinase
MEGGAYLVNDAMIEALRDPAISNHASNLGAILADHYARKFGVDAWIVDPVTVDEFVDEARLSGVTWCQRKSRAHALNIKYCAHRAATEIGKPYEETRFVVAHMGGGTSIAAVSGGRILDSNDAMHGMGPYSPERAGALPIGPLVEHCFTEGVTKKELLDQLARKSGLTAYCGTSDVQEILKRLHNGDHTAEMAIKGMVYQTAKEIGAMATVLEGWIDAVILTGGVAHSPEIISMLRPFIGYLGEIIIYPGEGELEALAAGAFRVLDGTDTAKQYG